MTAPSTIIRHRSAVRLVSCLFAFITLLSSAGSALAIGTSSLFGEKSSFGANNNGFLPVDEALPFSDRTDNDSVVLSWNITPGHYLYKGRISVTATSDNVKLGEPEFSLQSEPYEDEYFGEVEVFYDPVEAKVPVQLSGGVTEATLQVTYQGCAKAGLCYPPQTREVLFYPGNSVTPEADSTREAANPAIDDYDTSSATGLAGFLARQSSIVIAGVFFLLGLGLTFTPCVLPMVPIISSLVSGHNTRTTGHALLLASSYVLGMALTYAAAGVITGLLGASFNLQAQLQSPFVLGLFAILFVAFALSMFDLFEIQLPRFIREPLNDASHRLTGSRVLSIFGIGALSALIVSPCVSAPLAGSLLYISTTQDAFVGGIALFALGLGMGVPLILVAVGGRKLLPGTGHWMTAVKHFYGVMLLAVAIWLVERLVPAWASLSMWGLLVAITGVQLGAFDAARAGWERTRKGLGLVMFAYGIALLAGAVTGANDPLKPLEPFTAHATSTANPGAGALHSGFLRTDSTTEIRSLLAQARSRGEPVMLDFYADWCISCKVMERTVFSDSGVMTAMSPFTLLQIDITDNTPEQQALLNELGLFGPPAILFYGSNGNELAKQRVLGEMDKEEFLAHIRKLNAGA